MTIRKVTNRSSTITVSSTTVSGDANTSTGAFDLPAGTTAQRPGSPTTGNIRHNTETAVVEFYDGNSWVPTVPLTAIDTISGNIFYNIASQIDINFTDSTLNSSGNTITFKAGATTVATVTSQTVINGVISNVSIPSAVYQGYSAGNNISISMTTATGLTTNAVTTTILSPATGGNTVVTSSDGTYRYHAFTAGGTFNSQGVTSVEYLVVGGGGGGGGSNSNSNVGNGGGGGAGGLLNGSLTLNANTAYTVTVGPGGGVGIGLAGSDSTISGTGISTVTAIGGGGGGAYSGVSADTGGSGGGGGYSGSGASGTAGQGNAGGNADGAATGGGGGAGAAGSNGSGTQAGAGGIGRQFSHWATATSTGDGGYYAGGGGGGGTNYSTTISPGAGGQGGGASGGPVNQTPTAATANTGGGGGGRSVTSSSGSGGAGGSGVVIIRYALT